MINKYMSLYKYVSPTIGIKIIENKKIRFSQIKALNDTFEMKPHYEQLAPDGFMKEIFNFGGEEVQNTGFNLGYDFIEQVFEEIKNSSPKEFHNDIAQIQNQIPEREKFLEQAKSEHPDFIENNLLPLHHEQMPGIREVVSSEFNDKLGILCLSELCDSLTMWAHYAQNSEGFVIEFDENHEFFNMPEFEGSILGKLQKVSYSPERINKQNLIDLTPEDIAFCKSESWDYEREWRMVKNLSDETLLLDEANEPVKDLKEQPIHLFPFPIESMKGVILGSRIKDIDKKKIIEILSREEYEHINLLQAVEDEREYKLNINAIN